MSDKFEINIDFLAYFRSNEKIKAEDFKESKTAFSIFDANGDGELDSKEIYNVFKQIVKYSNKNQHDTRQSAYTIFDETEAQSFVNETTAKDGKTFSEIGVSIKEIFNLLNTLMTKSVDDEEEIVSEEDVGNFKIEVNKPEKAELTEEQKKIAKELSNIPERKDQQFTKEECEQLAQLTPEELQEARKYFYTEGRNKQFTAHDICCVVQNIKEKYDISPQAFSRFSELANIKDKNGNELSATDIIEFLSFSDEDINKAITLLTHPDRQINNMTVRDIEFIIKSHSSYLYNLAAENPELKLDRQEMTAFVGNMDIRECKLNGKTYRFIIGQELPEEVNVQQVGKDVVETIYNPNLNITQIVTYENTSKDNPSKNPTKIETRHLDKNGNTEYTEVYENGEIAGTQNIYIIDKNGKKTILQSSYADKETGVQKFVKNFIDDNGTETDFELTSNPQTNEYELSYTITNPDGVEPKVLYSKKQSLKSTGDKTFIYTKDGKTYNISISEDNKINITDNENQTYQIDLNRLFPDKNAKFIANRFIKMPAEMLVYLANNPLEKITYGEFKENNGHFDKERNLIEFGEQTLPKSEIEMEDTVFSILMHEFGHCLDFTIGEEPDFFSKNPEFAECFKAEVDNFKRNHTSAEQNIVGYFTGATTMEGIMRGQQEVVAEINMLTNTVSKEGTAARAYFIQRYFPKTVAMVTQMIQQKLQK